MEQKKDNIIIEILTELYDWKNLFVADEGGLNEKQLMERMVKTNTCIQNLFTLMDELETMDGDAPYLKNS
jgi:hypothetical protein